MTAAARTSVLVVDDEPEILMALEDLFEADYDVLRASDASAALAILAQRPDVGAIVSDQRMPGMNGDRFLEAARDLTDAGGILLTGYADLEAVAAAVNQGGIVGYSRKPWDPSDLKHMVAATCARTALARDLDVERALLSGLLGGSTSAISFKDRDGRFVRLNARKAALLNADPASCLGRRESDVAAGGARAERLDAEVMRGGTPHESTDEFVAEQGESTIRSTQRLPIRDARGHVAWLMTIERDITEKRLLEARLLQAEKMQALGTLTGGIAHDFNNLLSAIIGPLDFVERRLQGDERSRRYIRAARESAERGSTLTRRLLNFSHPQPLDINRVTIDDLVLHMQELVVHTLGPTVTIKLDLGAPGACALINADQLELAILNLCVNARDAMPDGGAITVATRTSADTVDIVVADEGTGIPPHVLKRVFEPFFTTKPLGKGTGLGLSMVYTLAKQAGGTADIDSTEGAGTRVTIRLPRALSDVSSPAAEPDPAPARILVVDDDPFVRAMTATYAGALGHHALQVSSGEEALALLDEGTAIDLVILDYAMPGLNGAETAARIHEHRPDMPILFVTAHVEPAAVETLQPCLLKPFRQDDLKARLATDAAPHDPQPGGVGVYAVSGDRLPSS